MAHLPTFNISLIKESNNVNNLKPSKKLSLKQVMDNPIKLIELSDSLNQINKELYRTNEENILQNKYFVYPIRSATIITIILIVIGLMICVTKKWGRNNWATPTPT